MRYVVSNHDRPHGKTGGSAHTYDEDEKTMTEENPSIGYITRDTLASKQNFRASSSRPDT